MVGCDSPRGIDFVEPFGMNAIDHQLKSNDCGISAIKTVFNIFRKEIDRNYILSQVFLDEKGSSMGDIKKFFDGNGCVSRFKFLDIGILHKDLSSLEGLFPFILPIKKTRELHYVVVNGIKRNKLRIYDPARNDVYYLSFAELTAIAHYSDSYWELADLSERMEALCAPELSRYNISFNGSWDDQDPAQVFNKLAYFSYIRDNFGFKNEEAEKTFLKDILFNQELTLPKQFRQLKFEREKIKLSAPLVLSIRSLPDAEMPAAAKPEETNSYIKLFGELGVNKKLWYIYLFTALFAASVAQLTVFVNQILLDHVLPSFRINILTLFAVGFALFRIFNLLISQYKHFVAIHVGNILDKYFLFTFNEKLDRFSLRYAQAFRRGDLSERLSDARTLKTFFVTIFSGMLVDTFVSLYSLGILFLIQWQLALLICGVMVLYCLWFKVITPYLRSNEQKRFIIKADFISRMIEKIDGNQVIKCFRLEPIFSNKIRKSVKDLIDIQTQIKYIDLVNVGVISVISTVAYTLIVVFLARNSIFAQTLTFGQLITFIMLSERVFSALAGILGENLALQENEVILKRYFDFNEPPKPVTMHGISDFNIEKVSLSKLNFGYNPASMVLRNIDFEINRGERIKIEGGNGSGKSSLSKILSFLYDPDSGDISINDTKSIFFNRDALKDKVLLVTNEDILFNETIEFNITFGRTISHSRIVELAKEIGLYDFISSHEEGLQYTISENGRNLSTGQRKKILIMRALLSKGELVILDEVLSGIDLPSRERIEGLIDTFQDKTFIVISHEPVRKLRFDRNFVLTNGVLTHGALTNRELLHAQLQ
jgi:subfamily B ATP-binding cassette protein HlyB/CyaB